MRNATALRGLSITLAALAHLDNGERVPLEGILGTGASL